MLAFLFVLSAAEECSYFECKDGSRVVPASFVNDNFCDCLDGSDEPLTSACHKNLFACPEKTIFASWVQDGVCDCCDGSDEPEGLCANTCSLFYKSKAEQAQAQFASWQRGLKVKLQDVVIGAHKMQGLEDNLKSYEKQLKNLESQIKSLKAFKNGLEGIEVETEEIDEQIQELEDEKSEVWNKKDKESKWKGVDFGSQQEFASLLGKKLEMNAGKYDYGIEFFDNAYQSEGNMKYSLGYWEGFEENYSIMKFERGTSCPNGISRSLKVYLKCSDAFEFVEFKEVSMCTYEATITLPAACKFAFDIEEAPNHY